MSPALSPALRTLLVSGRRVARAAVLPPRHGVRAPTASNARFISAARAPLADIDVRSPPFPPYLCVLIAPHSAHD